MIKSILILILLASFCVRCDDPVLAEALAKAGAVHAAKGNDDQACDLFYRALAYDEHCGNALFELAKIAEKKGDKNISIDLYEKAFPVLHDEERILECEKRLRTAKRLSIRLSDAVLEYNKRIVEISKTYPERTTFDFAIQRVDMIRDFKIVPEPRIIDVIDLKSLIVGEWQMSDSARLLFKPDGSVKFSASGRETTGKWNVSGKEVVVIMSWINKYKFTARNFIVATNCQLTGSRIEKNTNARK